MTTMASTLRTTRKYERFAEPFFMSDTDRKIFADPSWPEIASFLFECASRTRSCLASALCCTWQPPSHAARQPLCAETFRLSKEAARRVHYLV